MDIALRHHAEAVLELRGRWTVSPSEIELLEFRSTIDRLIGEGQTHIVIDIAGLQGLDARGLGELVMTQQKLWAAGGKLSLVGLNAVVRRMLSVTRLDTVLPVADDELPPLRTTSVRPAEAGIAP